MCSPGAVCFLWSEILGRFAGMRLLSWLQDGLKGPACQGESGRAARSGQCSSCVPPLQRACCRTSSCRACKAHVSSSKSRARMEQQTSSQPPQADALPCMFPHPLHTSPTCRHPFTPSWHATSAACACTGILALWTCMPGEEVCYSQLVSCGQQVRTCGQQVRTIAVYCNV